jgi:rhamnose transport system permease protein
METALHSPPASPDTGNRFAERALRLRVGGVLVFMVLLSAAFGIASPRYLTVENARIIAFNAAILIIAACAEALVVITRNLDVSVGSVMGMAGYLAADLVARFPGIGFGVVFIPLIVGTLLGCINGALVAYGRVPSIVATLGTLSIFRGVTFIYARGQEVTSTRLPTWMLRGADLMVAGIPSLVIVAALVVLALSLLLNYRPRFRQLYAVGSNPQAAHFYGLRTKRVVLLAYALAGLLGGLAGFLYAARVGTVTVILARGWELSALAAVVIGGVSVQGGSGNLLGVALGAIVLATIDNGLVLLGVPEFWRMFIQGTAIILAVSVDAVIDGRIRRMLELRRAGRRT